MHYEDKYGKPLYDGEPMLRDNKTVLDWYKQTYKEPLIPDSVTEGKSKKMVKEGFGDGVVEHAIEKNIERWKGQIWFERLWELTGYGEITCIYDSNNTSQDEPNGIYFDGNGDGELVIVTENRTLITEGYYLCGRAEEIKKLGKKLQEKLSRIISSI